MQLHPGLLGVPSQAQSRRRRLIKMPVPIARPIALMLVHANPPLVASTMATGCPEQDGSGRWGLWGGYAERRGFVPGHELDDWLAAEEEEDSRTRPLAED